MPRFLRKVRKARWASPSWVTEREASHRQGDALIDLSTTKNCLSVYQVDSDEKLRQVVTGLAAGSDNLGHVDYMIIEGELLDVIGLQAIPSDGETPHAEANLLHRDIVDLTADDILNLTHSISADDVCRVLRPKVRVLIQHALNDGQINPAQLKFSVG